VTAWASADPLGADEVSVVVEGVEPTAPATVGKAAIDEIEVMSRVTTSARMLRPRLDVGDTM
jgi:hypothetical protein